MSQPDSSKNLISINSIGSLLKFSGNEVVDFLNNFLISNLTALNTNHFHYSALCNPKGRIISSLWINIHDDENISMICPNNILDDLMSFFNMRKFRLKISITKSQETIIINTQNDLIYIEPTSTSTNTITTEAFYLHMFKLGLPWIEANYTEKFIPQHVNLDLHDKVMSFSKGCYPGQEIIARIKYLGKIKKRMVLLQENDENLLSEQIENHDKVSPIIYNEDKNTFSIQVIEKVKA